MAAYAHPVAGVVGDDTDNTVLIGAEPDTRSLHVWQQNMPSSDVIGSAVTKGQSYQRSHVEFNKKNEWNVYTIIVPNDPSNDYYLVFDVLCSLDNEWEMWEDSTHSYTLTTDLGWLNRKRKSSNTTSATLRFYNTTVTGSTPLTGGLQIRNFRAGAIKATSSSSGSEPFILKNNAQYHLIIRGPSDAWFTTDFELAVCPVV